MKEGWEVKKLGESLAIERGGSPRPIEKYMTDSPDGINWIKISDATASEKYIYETKEKITRDGLHKTRIVNEGDFILSNSMSFGRPYIMKTTGCIHDGWLVLKQNDKKIFETEFLYYLLSSPIIFQQFNFLAAGSTVRNLNIALVSSVNVPVPPLAEQQHIVSILDKAFAAIDKAKANAEQNLRNAKELFEGYLQEVFEGKVERWEERSLKELTTTLGDGLHGTPKYTTDGEYYFINGNNLTDGKIEFKESTKRVSIEEYNKYKKNLTDRTVLVSINGTLGNVAFYNGEKIILGKSACYFNLKESVDKNFIKYLLVSPFFLKYAHKEATGATIKNVSLKTMREFIVPFPSKAVQQSIVQKLDALSTETKKLEAIYRQKIVALEEMKKAVLAKAFSGELSSANHDSITEEFPALISNIAVTDLHAGIIALAYSNHQERGLTNLFGHVKAEKISHMAESYLGIQLNRQPFKDAAGPNDFPLARKMEFRAEKAGFFTVEGAHGDVRTYIPGINFDKLIDKTKTALSDILGDVNDLLSLMLPMSTQEAEIFATVFAAWNNLLMEDQSVTDEAIVFEARENWHASKMKIPRERFFHMIEWMKEQNIIPQGRGKKVLPKPSKA